MWRNFLETLKTDKRRAALVGAGVVIAIILLVLALRGAGKERVLATSLENLRDATTYHAEAKLLMTRSARIAQNRPRPIVEVTFFTEGDVKELDNGQPVFTGRMRNEARGTGMVLFADGDIRLLPNAVAFRLENLPTLLNPKGNLLEKWTYVEVPTLETRNAADVQGAFASIVQKAEYTDSKDGLYYYRVSLTAEEEQALTEIFRQSTSGNRALHILARLLSAYDVRDFTLAVDPQDKELRTIDAVFVNAEARDQEPAPAQLTLSFSDYGKDVVVEEPPKELTVQPTVFSRIFGTGDIEEITNEQQEEQPEQSPTPTPTPESSPTPAQ